MSMGTREDGKQPPIWVEASELARGEGEGHIFYRHLNELLRRHGFDAFVEKRVLESEVFSEGVGRPSIPPGILPGNVSPAIRITRRILLRL